MKFRYFKSSEVRKAKRAEKRQQQRRERKEDIAKWRSRFVIWPTIISTPGDGDEFATRVCFETIWEKAYTRNNVGPAMYDEEIWTRHTEKEYFIKKLDGTLDPEEKWSTLSHDGTDMDMSASGSVSSGPSGPVSYG